LLLTRTTYTEKITTEGVSPSGRCRTELIGDNLLAPQIGVDFAGSQMSIPLLKTEQEIRMDTDQHNSHLYQFQNKRRNGLDLDKKLSLGRFLVRLGS
jgi:hypothetical protein